MTVAVMPFAARDDHAGATELAHGLTADVTTGLSRFGYLQVQSCPPDLTARDPRAVGAALGVRYVADGSVRCSGPAIRVNARLTDVGTGAHLWAEQYDRDGSAGVFTLQDDLASRIVATLADGGGVLSRALAEMLRDVAPPGSAPALFMRMARYVEHFTAEEHLALASALGELVQREPANAQAWAYLSILYGQEIFFDFNPRPDTIGRVRHTAERAVALDAGNQSAWYALAEAEFFERHRASFMSAADRAIELNPLNTRTVGGLGLLHAYAGDTARGAALATRAMALNPRYPSWFHIAPLLDAYRRGDAEGAFTHAARANLPHLPVGGRLLAIAAAGRFGRETEARTGLAALARTHPTPLDTAQARREWGRWLWEGDLLDALVDGYAKALARG